MQLTTDIAERLAVCLDSVRGLEEAERIGAAVSGGGDSMALLSLMQPWCARRSVELRVVSVDHGIRAESRSECRLAGEFAAGLGVEHETVVCRQLPAGNIQDAARRVRHSLIADWAKRNRIGFVALAHTLDDQAETFLLNLARGSGVDGLAAMPVDVRKLGIRWLRPLLKVGRAELREYLQGEGIRWAEDPTNSDERFGRTRARRLFDSIGPLGATRERLAAAADRMQEAREVLEDAAAAAEEGIMTIGELGEVRIGAGFWRLKRETRLRIGARAVVAVSGSEYRPRLAALISGLEAVRSNRCFSLSGCLLLPGPESGFTVARELAACGPQVAGNSVWDRRWRLGERPAPPGSVIGPLGEAGLRTCSDWRLSGHPREVLVASPALWSGGKLLSAPFAGMANGWRFRLDRGDADGSPDATKV